ncbi:hypothetical protein H9623_09565 [Oerskovia sp. Sa1BUA8]|uniref:Uncharacterized protein n=1 Tax=Oerskovia douganii TaxID=2762210 RepID=A0A9D5UCK9_9CELL|nr:hypothetical protein [Oerskovia douganii]MBE7700551.1 hypothetical protein [Oerskovia douganii]
MQPEPPPLLRPERRGRSGMDRVGSVATAVVLLALVALWLVPTAVDEGTPATTTEIAAGRVVTVSDGASTATVRFPAGWSTAADITSGDASESTFEGDSLTVERRGVEVQIEVVSGVENPNVFFTRRARLAELTTGTTLYDARIVSEGDPAEVSGVFRSDGPAAASLTVKATPQHAQGGVSILASGTSSDLQAQAEAVAALVEAVTIS